MTASVAVTALSALLASPALAAPPDLDLSFSDDGKELTNFRNNLAARDVVRQREGRLVVASAAAYIDHPANDFVLTRYTADGRLDESFSGDGKVSLHPAQQAEAAAVAIQPDGKILVAGTAYQPSPPNPYGSFHFTLARLMPDGELDPTFSDDGWKHFNFEPGYGASAADVLVDPEGRLIVAGRTDTPTGNRFALARLDPNGELDRSFSGDGKQTFYKGHAATVLRQPDGKLVVAGTYDDYGRKRFALARFTSDGQMDPAFRRFGTEGGNVPSARAVWTLDDAALQTDGKIVVAGETTDAGGFTLARYGSDGRLDGTFSDDGFSRIDFPQGSAYAKAVEVGRDGKIVVAGEVRAHERPLWGLTRLSATGEIDNSFSGDGRVVTGFGRGEPKFLGGTGQSADVESLLIQPNGRPVVVGGSRENRVTIARYRNWP